MLDCLSSSCNEELENEDETEGFFHKMAPSSNEDNLLNKKRKRSSIDSTGNNQFKSKEENANQKVFNSNYDIYNNSNFEDNVIKEIII